MNARILMEEITDVNMFFFRQKHQYNDTKKMYLHFENNKKKTTSVACLYRRYSFMKHIYILDF